MAVTRTRSEKLIGLLSRNAASEKFLQNLQGKHGYRFLSRLLTRDDVLFLN